MRPRPRLYTLSSTGPWTKYHPSGLLTLYGTRVPVEAEFTSVSAGNASTCGVTTEDEVHCWGSNEHGLLGIGASSPAAGPTPIAGGVTANLQTGRASDRADLEALPAAELQEDRPPPDVQQLVGLYAKNAPRFVLAREWLSRIVDPALDVTFDGTGQSVDASLQLSATEGAHPQFGEVHDLLISTSLSLADGELRLPIRGKGSARRLARQDMGSVDSVRVSAEWVQKPDSDNPWPARLEISTGRIKHPKVTLEGARATLFPADFPRVIAHAWLPLEDENLALQIEDVLVVAVEGLGP